MAGKNPWYKLKTVEAMDPFFHPNTSDTLSYMLPSFFGASKIARSCSHRETQDLRNSGMAQPDSVSFLWTSAAVRPDCWWLESWYLSETAGGQPCIPSSLPTGYIRPGNSRCTEYTAYSSATVFRIPSYMASYSCILDASRSSPASNPFT